MQSPFKPLYIRVALLLAAISLLPPACAASNITAAPLKDITSPPLSITLLHVGDTNSYVIPHDIKLTFNDKETLATVGGWSLLMAAVEDIRSREKNVLLLHAGGVIEGTMWTSKFGGLTDIDAMNTLQFDALVPGDSEFSNSTAEAVALIKKAKFPVLAANMDILQEPALAGMVKPYTVVESGGQLIGVIGLVTPDIAHKGQTVRNINISSPLDAVRKYVAELNRQGINKIIILSHLGYAEDVAMAGSVSGIDVIVGGHSATFMGGNEFEQIGLKPDMPYPAELKGPDGDRVLIVHAWENNQLLGQIKLDFDEKGRISNYLGQPFIPAMNSFQLEEPSWGWSHLCSCRPEFGAIMETMAKNPGIKLYWDNADMASVLQPYINEISSELNNVVAVADENLYRGLNKGPGPIIADAFLWSARKVTPDVQLAIYDSNRVRSDIFRGNVLANNIHLLLPFRQTLSIMTVHGAVLKSILEKGIDSCIEAGGQPPFYEISGFKMTVDVSRKSGERITSLQLLNADGSYFDMNMDGRYTMAIDRSFADRGVTAVLYSFRWMGPLTDGFSGWLKGYFGYIDTGIKDTDAVADYLRVQKNIKNVTEERTVIAPPSVK
jgi:5'-nucleotidase/UDP-sugar diphosphatase